MKVRLFAVSALVVSMALFVPGGGRLSAAQAQPAAPVASAPDHAHVSTALRSAPLMFIENVGQFPASPGGTSNERARFQVHGSNSTLWLFEDKLWVTLAGSANLKLSFVGVNPHPYLEPFNRLETRVSYFVGRDPARWRADVPVWGGVRYVDLYPGVDLEVTGDGGRWAWQLAIRNSQFAMSNVRLRVEGADALTLDGDVLRLTTPLGEYALPLLQVVGAADANLASPAITGDQVAWPFASASHNPPSAIANPQSDASDLLYSTFLGGSGEDRGSAIAVDRDGNTYVAGTTNSSDFPTTTGAFDASHNGYDDVFVAKVNASGTALAYATFLGGGGLDIGEDIAVDGAGNAYVAGWTESGNFPTTAGAFSTSYNGGPWDAFVVKLNADGTALAYATFLGGGLWDIGYAVAVDGAGSAYVAGETCSSDFPTTAGAFDTSLEEYEYDAFVVKLNAGGTGLAYATFLGGDSSGEIGWAIAVDGTGNAYVTGSTTSSDFPTTAGAFDASYNGQSDTFVAKLNAGGTGLVYATFLGGSGEDEARAITVDRAGSAYVTGSTISSDFPTTAGAFDTSYNGQSDVFLVKVNADGAGLVYSTFLGGSNWELGFSIAVDGVGSAYVMGSTESPDFPTTEEAFDVSYSGNGDAFLVKVNANGMRLACATFLGESGGEGGRAIAVDGTGNAYVVGATSSSNFPTTAGALDTSHNGRSDVFMAKIRTAKVPPTPTEVTNPGFEDGFFGPVGQSVANGWAFYIAGGGPTFDGERTTIHSGNWAQKVSGHAPFAAGVAQAVTVKPGASYRVTVYYQLYPPGDGQAFLGVQDGTAPAQWVGGGEGGVWRPLSQTLTVTSDRLTLYLHGHNGMGLNTNVYFDDVTVVELGQP